MSEDKAAPEVETIECKTLDEALAHVKSLEEKAKDALGRYHSAVQQLTGCVPGSQMGPMDIVRICQKIQAGNSVNA